MGVSLMKMTLLQVYEEHIQEKLQTNAIILFFLPCAQVVETKTYKNCDDIFIDVGNEDILKKGFEKSDGVVKMSLSRSFRKQLPVCHEVLGNNFRSVTKL